MREILRNDFFERIQFSAINPPFNFLKEFRLNTSFFLRNSLASLSTKIGKILKFVNF